MRLCLPNNFKNLLKNKFRLEKIILVLILLLVATPYLQKGYKSLLTWSKEQIQIKEGARSIKNEEAKRKKLDALVQKYNIYSLNYSYRIPEEVYNYQKTEKEIRTNEEGFNCEQPPNPDEYKKKNNLSNSGYFNIDFSKYVPSSLDPVLMFLKLCNNLKGLQPTYDKFLGEAPRIEKLLSESKNSTDVITQDFVDLLEKDLEKFLRSQFETNGKSSIKFSNNKEPFVKMPGQSFGHEGKYEPAVDVDNDGKLEKVLITWEAMNHGPHKIQIIKDNEIIFTVSDVQIEFIPALNHKGFYIKVGMYGEEGLCCRLGDRLIRFYFYNGEFKPVWQQDSKYPQAPN